MGRTLQFAAVVVFVAVLVMLLTPADDGPVLGLRGKQMVSAMLLGLLALATGMMGCVNPQYPRSLVLACCGAVAGYGGARARISPLLC